MYSMYRALTRVFGWLFPIILNRRAQIGKEDLRRLSERLGKTEKKRPPNTLIWLHAASVGEAQSALILINTLLKRYRYLNILVTTGTQTSATMMEKHLPIGAFHQYYPLDHPRYTIQFLDHWYPDLVLWMESELWPNMLHDIRARNIPSILINARLSDRSAKRWSLMKGMARSILTTFDHILCQTQHDAHRYTALGTPANITVTDNLKYSAAPLPFDDVDLKTLSGHIMNRPVWLYASSHKGEEELACRAHEILKATIPDLLTIIVPRHPDRRGAIQTVCETHGLKTVMRGTDKNMPAFDTDIYIADTMGELGLFYRLAPIACIGRSFSDDGGGGHNPLEAAQLGCAVLHGPNVQFQKQLYADMHEALAALPVHNETDLVNTIRSLLTEPEALKTQQDLGIQFARSKAGVVDHVMDVMTPVLNKLNKNI